MNSTGEVQFTEEQVNEFVETYHTSQVQANFKIVGQIRFHTVHTNERDCRYNISLVTCYETEVSSSTINTTNLGNNSWEIFKTAEEVSETYVVTGDMVSISGTGFTLDIDPSITASEFLKIWNETKSIFLAEAARGLIITCTVYSQKSDWWLYNLMFYEYVSNDRVILNEASSIAFRPNLFETPVERIFFNLIVVSGVF